VVFLVGVHGPDGPVLVRQKPDACASEEQLHAASAQVGVATANLLPNVSISANIGANALALSKVADYLSSTNRIVTAALSVTQPDFLGFSLLNQKRAAEENIAQVQAQYRAVVLAALQDVADVLHALQADANELRAASEFEKAAKTNFNLVHLQFERGYIKYIASTECETGLSAGAIERDPDAYQPPRRRSGSLSGAWRGW